MMELRSRRNEEGIALVTVTIIVAVVVLILMALGARVILQVRRVDANQLQRECFYGTESGAMASWADLEDGGNGKVGLGTWVLAPGTAPSVDNLPTHETSGIAPVQLTGNPNVTYMGYAHAWSGDLVDNNGDGAVDGVAEVGYYSVYGMASDAGVDRAVELVIASTDVNVWRNAIFAGTGAAGGLINGNVAVHGSVHLLGDNLVAGVTAISALDLSGTALIHNNYAGIPASLSSRIPALPTKNFGGENIETLSAKLRVKNGLVGMSGNSEIGEVDITGNTYKETMDGTYVEDGWTGNSVIDDGGRGDPQHVSSDNGWDDTYDLGNKVSLPELDDDWRDPITGLKVVDPATGTFYTHESYFTKVLTGTPKAGNVQIKANTDFYYNATFPAQTDPALRLPTDDYIYFKASTNIMELNGQIKINGDLAIDRGSGSDKTIHYTGRGAILVKGNVSLDTELYSRNADGTTANSFPVNNFFGIMASGNLTMGTNSQLELMGGFYAQGQIKSTKQTIVTGTYVSNYFDMGTNVPEIYQVPTLADNLPLGMIGAYPILTYAKVSWRELPSYGA
jgi:hypothetical protein